MGQSANNRGRNASLDNKKARSAGRGARATERDFDTPRGRGKVLGAFGSTKSADAGVGNASRASKSRAK